MRRAKPRGQNAKILDFTRMVQTRNKSVWIGVAYFSCRASAMRTAIVHYWLVNMRGGEKVLEALCRLMPEADIFTLYYDPERVSPFLRSRRIHTSFLNPLRRHYRTLLPLAPMALEQFDLRDYDLVVSSEAGPAKGVLTASGTRHVCYCHTPMRYLWD